MNQSLEPFSVKAFRWLGIGAACAIVLSLIGLVLYFILRQFDKEVLVALTVISLLAALGTWPLAWILATRSTERFYLLLQQGQTPGRSVVSQAPPIENRNVYQVPETDQRAGLMALNLTELQAAQILSKLDGEASV